MERTVVDKSKKNVDLQVLLGEVVARMQLASTLGLQYQGTRDIYQSLGYSTTLNFDDYLARYLRQDIAKAIIDRPVKATWQGNLELIETDDPKETEFEKAWIDLDRALQLKNRLTRVDKLTGIGHYGVLLLGLDDVKNAAGFIKPAKTNNVKLLYVKPYSEKSAKIDSYVTDPTNERYGYPLVYAIEVADVSSGASTTVRVHYTRIVHIVDDSLESEIVGVPRLEAVFNRLMDLDKIVGGDAEMYWRGARPGYQGKVDKDYQMTDKGKEELTEQIDEFENKLRRILINEGVDLEALAQQIADPSNHVDVQLTMISAVTGIPKRVLSGSERGELASSQDAGEWKTYVQARREDYAEPKIIRPFVDRLIELGILPKPGEDYRIDWLDLFSISEKERVEIGQKRANALREYTTNPMAQAVIPPDAFFELFLGLDTGKIELVKKLLAAGINEDQRGLMEEIKKFMAPVGDGGTGTTPEKKEVKTTV